MSFRWLVLIIVKIGIYLTLLFSHHSFILLNDNKYRFLEYLMKAKRFNIFIFYQIENKSIMIKDQILLFLNFFIILETYKLFQKSSLFIVIIVQGKIKIRLFIGFCIGLFNKIMELIKSLCSLWLLDIQSLALIVDLDLQNKILKEII